MLRLLGILGLALAWIGQVSASIVYSQSTLWAGAGTDVGITWASQSDSGVNGFRTHDNFSLDTAATINEATWFGIYVNAADLTDAAPNTTDWIIRFQADNAGIPGPVLVSTTQSAGQVSTQAVGTGLYNDNPVTVYEFTAFFPTGFDAAANTPYWFSPRRQAPNFSPVFGWIQGIGGDGLSFQTAFTAGIVTDSFVRDGDRAFSLSQVPEPATTLLLGAGLAALALLRRRQHGAGV